MNILFRDQSLPNVSPLFNHDPLLFPLRRSSSSPMSAMLPIKTLVTIKLFNLSKSSSFSKFLVFDFISFPFSFSLSFIISLLSLSFLHFPFLLCSLFNPFCSLSPPSFLVTLPALCRLWSLSLSGCGCGSEISPIQSLPLQSFSLWLWLHFIRIQHQTFRDPNPLTPQRRATESHLNPPLAPSHWSH